MFLRRKPVWVTIEAVSNTSVDAVRSAAEAVGMKVNFYSYHSGEVIGRIEPRRIRNLRRIKAALRVVRHRPLVDSFWEVFDPV